MTAAACLFCALAAGRVPSRRLWEDEHHLAFFPLKHMAPGHTLLIPKAHADYVFDMDGDGYRALFDAAKRLAPAIRDVTGAKRVGLLVEGFSVPHVHVHLVPVQALGDIAPDRERELPAAEADRLAQALRAAMASAGQATQDRGGRTTA
jgi:histidine triad (HIT) family protein